MRQPGVMPHLDSARQTSPLEWGVTWDREANGYRLPTEAEWQVACRAAGPGPRYGDLDEIAWYADNSLGFMHPVAEKNTQRMGAVVDTLGGVWEWCWDQYDAEAWVVPHHPGRRLERPRTGVAGSESVCKTNPEAAFDDLGFRLTRTITE